MMQSNNAEDREVGLSLLTKKSIAQLPVEEVTNLMKDAFPIHTNIETWLKIKQLYRARDVNFNIIDYV